MLRHCHPRQVCPAPRWLSYLVLRVGEGLRSGRAARVHFSAQRRRGSGSGGVKRPGAKQRRTPRRSPRGSVPWRLIAVACVLAMAAWFWRPRGSGDATVSLWLQRARSFVGETRTPSITITFPEGISLFTMAERLEAADICAADAFVRAALGTQVTVHGSTFVGAEGFLFPDTYQWRQGTSAARIVATMVANFERRTAAQVHALQRALPSVPDYLFGDSGAKSEAIAAAAVALNRVGKGAEPEGPTIPKELLWNWVTFASIVEKEAGAGELARVAGVFANRLARLPFEPRRLQADATRVYAALLREHRSVRALAAPDAFDTYRHAGLTPAPIGNPGLDALEASLQPEVHAYLYFVRHPKRFSHVFSETFAEHRKAVAAWRASQAISP